MPLIHGILNGTAMEHRMSWLIWAAVAALLFSSQFAKGARASLWLVGGELAGCLVVFVLSLRHGTGKLDLATTGIGLATAIRIWQVFPFALSSGWSIAVRVLLVVAIAGSCIALVVQIVSLARWFTGHTPA